MFGDTWLLSLALSNLARLDFREGDDVDGGYRATGRWPFASGCTHATWIIGGCRAIDGDQPRAGPDGAPERRWLFFRATDCELLDTWYTTGLRGTGSHDYAVADLFVPNALASAPVPPVTRQTDRRRLSCCPRR